MADYCELRNLLSGEQTYNKFKYFRNCLYEVKAEIYLSMNFHFGTKRDIDENPDDNR